MSLSAADFLEAENKGVTLVGLSGIGKTALAEKLAREDWFHYCNDYRIGTAYLHDPQDPESFSIAEQVTIDNIAPVSRYLGMVGDPEKGGLPLDIFKKRQKAYSKGEISAGFDMEIFAEKARNQYQKLHFLNDTTGSLCELGRLDLLEFFAARSILLYIRADDEEERTLFERAMAAPKPLYYHPDFFDRALGDYMQANEIQNPGEMDPAEFYRWIVPKLIESRKEKYEAIVRDYGYVASSHDIHAVRDSQDFISFLSEMLASRAR